MPAPLSPAEEERAASAPVETPAAPVDFPLRRIAVFGSIVSAILLFANAVVSATVGHFFGIRGWGWWQLLTALPALLFIPTTILRFQRTHPLLKAVYAVSAVWLGALNFAFFASLACWATAGIVLLAGWPISGSMLAAGWFGVAALATAYGVFNAQWLRTKRVTVALHDLPEVWEGRTAVLATDLHLGPLRGIRFMRRVIQRMRDLKPDAVFISGDLFDGPTLGLNYLAAPWRDYASPRGVFYVTGNHDEFAERSLYINAVRGAGVRVLDNEKVEVDGLQIVGVHDTEAEDPKALPTILRQANLDRAKPSVLLAHRPVNLAIAEEAGISLQLSGHTHHGQLWPWNLVVRRIYGAAAYGLSQWGRLQVYTSSGAGTWGPPLRLGTQSEIVLLTFTRKR